MKTPVSIVSPIYNDALTIQKVLPRLVKLVSSEFSPWEIVLIDDGSTDESGVWVSRYIRGNKHIRLYVHKSNMGIARTYRELYNRANNDVIVLFSLDGGWDPGDAVRLAKTLIDKRYDFVVGVRRKKSYTLWRNIVSFLYNNLIRIIFGFRTQDAGSIKAMRKASASRIPIISKGVFDEAERLIRAHAAGYRIGFIDVSHAGAAKGRRGIRFSHVREAFVDSIRVWIDMRGKRYIR